MHTINPDQESITCPYCSNRDVRYLRKEGQWRCRGCGKPFQAKGEGNKIRIHEIEPRCATTEAL